MLKTNEAVLSDSTYAPDEKGREHVHIMTDRELLEEQVTTLRRIDDTVSSFVKSLETNPMFNMMAKRFGKS